MPKTRMRRGDPPPDTTSWVVRGGALQRETLRLNATANHAAYGFYSVSAWVAVDDEQLETLAAGKLHGAREVALMTVTDVRAAGLDLWDTGQNPHYDLVYGDGADMEALLAAVSGLPARIVVNAHYDPAGDKR